MKFTLPSIVVGFVIVIGISIFVITLTFLGWEKTKNALKNIANETRWVISNIADLIFASNLLDNAENKELSFNNELKVPDYVQCTQEHKNSLLQIFCSKCASLLIPTIRGYTLGTLIVFWWLATVLTGFFIGIQNTPVWAYLYVAILGIILLHVKMHLFSKVRTRLLIFVLPIGCVVFIFAFLRTIAESFWFQLVILAGIFVILFDLLRWSYQQYKSKKFTGDVLFVLVSLTINSFLTLYYLAGYIDINIGIFSSISSNYSQTLDILNRVRTTFGTIILILVLLKSLYAIYLKPIKIPTSLNILPIKKIDRTAIRFRSTEPFFLFRIFIPVLNLMAQPIAVGYNTIVIFANIVAAIIIVVIRFLWRYSQEILNLLKTYFFEALNIIIYFVKNILYPILLTLVLFASVLQIAFFTWEYIFNPNVQRILFIIFYLVVIGTITALIITNFTKRNIRESATSSLIDLSFSSLYFFLLLGISSVTLILLKASIFHNLPYKLTPFSLTGLWGALIVIMILVIITLVSGKTER